MTATNLAELYDVPTMSWAQVRERLDAGFSQVPDADDAGPGPGRHSTWLTTLDADGSPHSTALGVLWHRDAFWFETGRRTRKGRNIARDPRCSLTLSVREFDLAVNGRAELVTDRVVVAELARLWAAEGWPCEVDESGTALTAPFSAQSAGRPPWHVYRIDATSAVAVQTVEPGGATRWTF
ncbi:pyridoxamine 5'-phosphate oxidase family protein [Georgenia alba]|uniref:Pyridoxamine 5'-phosphate oxidase family protein n=1 Tax=Georgenia alba TaxID=2233858 RepID=A0ABW2Q8X8_9MICO